ncbi:MAG: hypothetical protein ABH807_01275 [Candidatus Shapirobacteria bacterium]
MGLIVDYCQEREVNKVIEVMCQSGEWDKPKQEYLGHDWTKVAHTFRGFVKSQGKLGIILVLKDGPKVVGALPLARVGDRSLLFGCSGILKKYVGEGDFLLDKELFQKIPKFYRTLLSYTRPSSLQWLPAPFRKKSLKNIEDLLQKWSTLPKFFSKSIDIYGPFNYCEFSSEKKRGLIKSGNQVNNVANFRPLSNSKSEIFDLNKSFKSTVHLYEKFDLYLSRFTFSASKAKVVCFAGSTGLSGSGYTDCCFVFCQDKNINLDKILVKAANFYRFKDKKRFFVLLPPSFLVKSQHLTFTKSLCQIFYDIPSNRDWRRRYLKLLRK